MSITCRGYSAAWRRLTPSELDRTRPEREIQQVCRTLRTEPLEHSEMSGALMAINDWHREAMAMEAERNG